MTSEIWHGRELTAVAQWAPERLFTITAPVQARILASGETLRHAVQRSRVPVAAASITMRKALRPRGRVAHLIGFDVGRDAHTFIHRINEGEVTAAPPKVVPAPLVTSDGLSAQLAPRDAPAWLVDAIMRYPWLRWLPMVVGVLIALLVVLIVPQPVGVVISVAVAASGAWLARRLEIIARRAKAVRFLRADERTPAAVDDLATSSDFRIGTPDPALLPRLGGAVDNEDARRFKEALRNAYAVDVAERTIARPSRDALALPAAVLTTIDALHPDRTILPRLWASVRIPSRILDQRTDDFGEVMVYPEIDQPMYEPLKDESSELFLPNIQLIENNSITLLETNQKFIESYMVGLNHEFARELLWREYPTDQRGSYFRQFWDVGDFLAAAGTDPESLRERLRDIPELHRWSVDSALGAHDHREAQGDKDEELVLVVRGELLKRYPTAVIYAHRADWERNDDSSIDKSRPRRLASLTPAQEADPPRDLVKTPLYEAKVDPDIYFFGFDLTAESARGGVQPPGEEDPGWFFVIKERPSEPRFGLDVPRDVPLTTVNTWNELSLAEVAVNPATARHLRVGERSVTLTDPGPASPAKRQHDEDRRFRWRGDTHAAEIAYILFQLPVLMAVHAAEMLEAPD